MRYSQTHTHTCPLTAIIQLWHFINKIHTRITSERETMKITNDEPNGIERKGQREMENSAANVLSLLSKWGKTWFLPSKNVHARYLFLFRPAALCWAFHLVAWYTWMDENKSWLINAWGNRSHLNCTTNISRSHSFARSLCGDASFCTTFVFIPSINTITLDMIWIMLFIIFLHTALICELHKA